MAFALFFLAEYANMILISALTAVFFFGGWLSPFQGYPGIGATFLGAPSFLWLGIKISAFLFLFLWFPGYVPALPASTRSCAWVGRRSFR